MSSQSLLRKLDNLESIIRKMLAAKWNNEDGRQLVEKKISQLEQLIADLSVTGDNKVECEQLVREWRDKVSLLWKLYYKLTTSPKDISVINCEDSSSGAKSRKRCNQSRRQMVRIVPPHAPPKVVDPELGALFQSIPSESVGHPITTEDFSAMEEYKSLLEVMANAYRLTLTKPQLNRCASQLAFSKLLPNLRNKFAQYYSPLTLSKLMVFMGRQITEHNQILVQSVYNAFGFDPMTLFSRDCVVYSDICRFCKRLGHLADNCPDIPSLLCFRCYHRGHTSKRCPNEPLIIVHE